MAETKTAKKRSQSTGFTPQKIKEILNDYRICVESREASILARKEVLSGRANFGIIGDGKELAQVAMAKAWQKGDFRAGYYRDQTLMMALGIMTLEEFFAQLYGDPELDSMTGGRGMNCHFGTTLIDREGNWTNHTETFNVSADISPTAGQMARGLGLALASKKYRENPEICGNFSKNGNEITFVTIGDASTSEGVFWESVNAASVMQVPLAVAVWDDGYGISVPKKYQTTKESISDALSGFDADERGGMDIHRVKAWDYLSLCETFAEGAKKVRKNHAPALFHVQEVTQQLGHSTSGDHRRYKNADRLQFELDFDCNKRFRQDILNWNIAQEDDLVTIELQAKEKVRAAAKTVYDHYHGQVAVLKSQLLEALAAFHAEPRVKALADALEADRLPLRYALLRTARKALAHLSGAETSDKKALHAFIEMETSYGNVVYSSNLTSSSKKNALDIPVIPAMYGDAPVMADGYEILNASFDANFQKYPQLYAFGEDVGQIGDVNQGMRGMQEKYGRSRIFDTGIREWTIMGQAIGMAMRGLRPIAEIQYLDYLLYGLAPLSDDLATLRWRTNNQQMAPVIIRTRGHRLVGVWHAGSPMGLMIHALRGMFICVPRNMVQAAGMYQTLLQSDDPAILVECLNGYRLKEPMPINIDQFTVPLGVPEVLQEGNDVTLITYGSSVRVAQEAIEMLEQHNISVELIDVQTLIPFDLPMACVNSVKKTNRVVFFDEDVQGGGTGYIMQQVLEVQGGYRYLDAAPVTICAKDHRCAYGQDGDYFSKPQAEDVFDAIKKLISE
jgi:pyruvate/2-oxoglutarate/acetoin dehydrogenase E1 component/TPP-dependent pyruvate/acetoin dehydrogenase alpha subunit